MMLTLLIATSNTVGVVQLVAASSSSPSSSSSSSLATPGVKASTEVFDPTKQSISLSSSSLSLSPPAPHSNLDTTTSATTTDDATAMVLQVIETEIWDGTNWIGASHRWTSMNGTECLSPSELKAPEGARFEGDWKIVTQSTTTVDEARSTSDTKTRDQYGWEYQIPQYLENSSVSPPERRRLWLRYFVLEEEITTQPPSSTAAAKDPEEEEDEQQSSLRISSSLLSTHSSSATTRATKTLSASSSIAKSSKQSVLPLSPKSPSSLSSHMSRLSSKRQQQQPKRHPLRTSFLRDQWNFKGFGFSIYKSLISVKTFGIGFRIPLTIHMNWWQTHPLVPSLSTSFVVYGYPLSIVCFLSSSIHLDMIRCSVYNAIQYCTFLFYSVLYLLWHGLCVPTVKNLVMFSLYHPWKRLTQILHSFVSSNSNHHRYENKTSCNSNDNDDSYDWKKQLSVASPKQMFLVLHKKVPTLRSPQLSSTLSEKIGVSLSWRVSTTRGYEFRVSYWYDYLPTIMGSLDHILRSFSGIQRFLKDAGRVSRNEHNNMNSNSIVAENSKNQASPWGTWAGRLHRRTASLGLTTSAPPYFGFSTLLSLSGFYFSDHYNRKGIDKDSKEGLEESGLEMPDAIQQEYTKQEQVKSRLYHGSERNGIQDDSTGVEEINLKNGNHDKIDNDSNNGMMNEDDYDSHTSEEEDILLYGKSKANSTVTTTALKELVKGR